MNNINDLLITYKTIKSLMIDKKLNQDTSFKRVLFYISTLIADNIINTNNTTILK